MTDRELLEAAARAAGHRIVEWTQDGNRVDVAIIIRGDGDGFSKLPWQPLLENQLTDADGDALRLAVRLGLLVYVFHEPPMTCIRLPGEHVGGKYDEVELHAEDPYAATRRAIARAAAQIGEGMV